MDLYPSCSRILGVLILATTAIESTAEVHAASTCDKPCPYKGQSFPCSARVKYLRDSEHYPICNAIKAINVQCVNHCQCVDSDFGAHCAPPSPPPPPPPVPKWCHTWDPPAAPATVGGLNGIRWPTMCVNKSEAHFFGIGDWGGTGAPGSTWTNPGVAAHRKILPSDMHAQGDVAREMKKLAAQADPDYILSAGDNFYPGGYNGQCSNEAEASANADADATGQFTVYHEGIYNGPGLDGKPWFSVLGNHDYGGRTFYAAWDSQIYRTWTSDGPRATWRMPAQYWSQTVAYQNFSVDYFFMDSNVLDARPPGLDPDHNMCQGSATCDNMTAATCCSYFQKLWSGSMDMLQKGLKNSTADWRIVVTHFPGPAISGMIKAMAGDIDLIFTGHTHWQQIGTSDGIDWIISGGGGGVTSDGVPDPSGHDNAYGFVDFTISKSALKIDLLSWGGLGAGKEILIANKTLTPKRRPSAALPEILI